jgi:IclR family mhp operon transcriptional activator
MSSTTKTVRALSRGLHVLKVLNEYNGSTAAEIVRHARLPRTTVLRSLETLSAEGYVARDPIDDRYRLTVLTRGLSFGFDDEAWVSDIARPLLFRLSREVVWPLSLETISGDSMVLRENTDKQSPLALQRLPGGYKFSVLGSSCGRAYLAFASEIERDTILGLVRQSGQAGDKLAQDSAGLEQILGEVRAKKCAIVQGALPKECAMSVPVLAHGVAVASLTLRFIASALTLDEATDRYLTRLQALAEEIGRRFMTAQG